jgi:hypothetical protein
MFCKFNSLNALFQRAGKNTITLVSIIAISVCAAASGQTIFETFDSDPIPRGWSITGLNPGNYAEYNPLGYMLIKMSRDSSNVFRFSHPIDGLDKTAEFWMEFDILHYEAGVYQNGNFGVFNSSAPSNETNAVFDRHNYGEYTSYRANRHDLYAYDSNGGQVYDLSPNIHLDQTVAPDCEYGDAQRVKMHYRYDASASTGMATLEVYKINDDGTEGRLLYSNGDSPAEVIGAGKSLTVDLFGFANRSNATPSSGFYNLNIVDNLYFSTSGSNDTPIAPDFFKEPEKDITLWAASSMQGTGSGSSAGNAALYTSSSLWDTARNALAEGTVTVYFLDGEYTGSLTLSDIGNDNNRLTIAGESEEGVVFRDSYFGLHGVNNCTFERIHFTGSREGYVHSVTAGSQNVLVRDCTWKDLTVQYGASGVKSGSHHVTFMNCVFERVGPTGGEHMLYNAYDAHHISIINCYFEDCTGDYVRFRDHTDCAEVIGCTFVSTDPAYNEVFISMPLFNDVDPGDEYFGTYYRFMDNDFTFYPSGGIRTAIRFSHSGYDPEGYNNLLTESEGEILLNGTAQQKKSLLKTNCGIDTEQVRVMGNLYQNHEYKATFGSFANYGAVSKGWSGYAPIFDLLNHTDPVMARCEDCLIGDFDQDNNVDLHDFYHLAKYWQIENLPVSMYIDISPLAGDGQINYDDLFAFVFRWLNTD